MSAYGREWEKHVARIQATRKRAQELTGKPFTKFADFHEHVSILRTVLDLWERQEYEIANITEED